MKLKHGLQSFIKHFRRNFMKIRQTFKSAVLGHRESKTDGQTDQRGLHTISFLFFAKKHKKFYRAGYRNLLVLV
jgi:hypothetical protein